MNILKELHKNNCFYSEEIEQNKVECRYRGYTFIVNTENNKSLLNDLEKTHSELIDKVYSEETEKEREEKKDLTQLKHIFIDDEYQIKAVFTIVKTFIDMLLSKENKTYYI